MIFRTNIHRLRSSLRGATLLEVLVTSVLLGSTMMIAMRVLSASVAQQRASEHRELALLEAHNLLRRITLRPWQDLTSDAFVHEALSDAGQQLPKATLNVAVTATAAAPPAKRIEVRVGYALPSGRPAAPVRLAAWVHQRPAERSP